jgi:gluconolactonase
MRVKAIWSWAVLVISVGVLSAQGAGNVVKLDGSLDAIVDPGAKLEIVKGEQTDDPARRYSFGALEGPVWVQDKQSGYLLFCDITANRVLKWSPDGQVSVFLEKSGFRGTDPSEVAMLGASGLNLDREGRLVIAGLGGREITRVEKNGVRTVLADRYEGKRLSGPNDLAIKSDGAVYFTDMPAALNGRDTSPFRELPFNGVYMVKDGTLRLLDKELLGIVPNGIVFSPDQRYLYVGGSRKIIRYDVRSDDTLANAKLFVDMSAETTPGGPDGMKVDRTGNVYSTGPGGVWILSPQGKHLGTIAIDAGVSNFAFGDPDGKSLYFTLRNRTLARVRLKTAGPGFAAR